MYVKSVENHSKWNPIWKSTSDPIQMLEPFYVAFVEKHWRIVNAWTDIYLPTESNILVKFAGKILPTQAPSTFTNEIDMVWMFENTYHTFTRIIWGNFYFSKTIFIWKLKKVLNPPIEINFGKMCFTPIKIWNILLLILNKIKMNTRID